jgi:type I restriction enzyme, S subunit
LPVPPFDEQEVIVQALEAQTADLNDAISLISREIAALQEFRTRLIADVVTGKLDVRAAGASLPEMTELEPIDELAGGEDLEEEIDDPATEEEAA